MHDSIVVGAMNVLWTPPHPTPTAAWFSSLDLLTNHVACLQKWGRIAEIMGDRTPFQCAMIYNDQKDYGWFSPWLSQYGRTKRRTVGNRQQRFLSSANAITARPDSADKPPRGVCVCVCAWFLHAAYVFRTPALILFETSCIS